MPENQLQPFDEQAVLRELEQLHHAIQASRREREHAVAKFDSFVKGFRGPAPPAADRLHVPDRPSPIRGPWVSDTAPPPPKNVPAVVQPSASVPVEPTASVPAEPIPPEPPPSYDLIASLRRRLEEKESTGQTEPPPDTWRSRSTFVLAAAFAALAVIASLLFVMSGRGPSSEPATPSAGPRGTAPATPATSAPPAVSAPVSTRALRVELTTLRPVWMRVTVDDNRALERQVPAGQRIPFEADRAIVVRAGDAGAVGVTVDGRNVGALGPDGQVVTRSFTPGPSATDRIPR